MAQLLSSAQYDFLHSFQNEKNNNIAGIYILLFTPCIKQFFHVYLVSGAFQIIKHFNLLSTNYKKFMNL